MIDTNYNRKSVNLQSANFGSLTQVRAQARDMGLLDNSVRQSLLGKAEEKEEEFEEKLDKKIEQNKHITPELVSEVIKYMVKIPSSAKKEDLNMLKSFLVSQQPGSVSIFVQLSTGEQVDTKISIADVEKLKQWENDTFK